LRPTLTKIFRNETSKKYIDSEKIFLGFFYTFIYKDFLLREIINKFKNIKKHNLLSKTYFSKLDSEYSNFIKNDFV